MSCLRWHFLGTHAYEIKSIDCLLKPEFVLVPSGNFENISIALLWCTTIETFGRKYKTIIEGVFVSAFSDIRFHLPAVRDICLCSLTKCFKTIESSAPQSTLEY